MAEGRHAGRAEPRRKGRVGRRGLLALAVAAVLLVLGLSSQGSFAFWTDSSTVTGGTITAGTMDLQLATGGSTGAVGQGTAFAASDIAVPSLTPSESYAFPVTVKDVGDADFTYTATVAGQSGWGFAAGAITVQLFAGTVDRSDTTYPVQQKCGSGATGLTTAAVPVKTTAATAIPTRRLAHGGSDTLCLVVAMDAAADGTNQGKSGVLTFGFTATQVTS